MTASLLLALISAGLLLQLAVGICIALWQRRRSLQAVPQAIGHADGPSGAWSGWRDFRVVRRTFEDATHTQCSFHLEPADGSPAPPFLPGQYLTFELSVADAAAPGGRRTITRCYSLSDTPGAQGYRITIKRALPPAHRPDLPPGAASSHFHDHVREGDVLRLKAPAGRFILDPDPSVPVVLIAGGIGVTPMMSMLLWAVSEQPGRPVHLFYGLRDGGEHAFRPALDALVAAHPNVHLTVAYCQPGPGDVQGRDFQLAGFIDIDTLKTTLQPGRHQFYVCGPAAMMESLVPALAAWGIPAQDIHFEAFGPASVRLGSGAQEPVRADAVRPLDISFRRSGRTLAWDGQATSLLEFAEHHGVAVDSGCRSGSCGSCETGLLSGHVVYPSKPDHDIAPGRCLLCVGVPASALVLDA